MSRFKFFDEGKPVSALKKSTEEIVSPVLSNVSSIILPSEGAKYRVEQMVITKLNGIVQSHAETKRDFSVEKNFGDQELVFRIEMLDNIININPEALKGAIDLMVDIDLIKNDITVTVDRQTGKINKIINHDEIIEKWNKHKKELSEKYNFLRDPETKLQFLKFITVAQNVITIEKNLILDMNSKLFFDLFFDKYLVSENEIFEPYSRIYYSQLFDDQIVSVDYVQSVNSESYDKVNINRNGNLDLNSFNEEKLIQIYNEKFKPLVQYKFSNFNVKYTEHYILNTVTKWIELSEVTIIEEVKNNVEIITDYKLRKID